MQTAQMAGNFNYQPRTRNRPPSKRGQLKEAHHRKSRSSSDDEEFHSDDNLRPYEEVKVAYHDKKLDGLGIATPESVELSALGVSHPERRLNIQKNSNFYKYMETSDGEGDSEHNVSTNTGSLNVHNQGSQCSISSNELDNQTFKQISDVPRLTDSGLSSRLTNSPAENHNHHRPFTSHYPQACVPTSLPPCFAPPPPPIEDIPHRTTAPPCRQRSFGPSNRGNYSDAETCLCRSPYADASTALLHSCPPHRGHYSDGEQYPQLRHCPYSGEESDFEPHYLEQTASGNVYIPDHSRCPQTVPRSGSVPLSRSNEMVNSPLIRPQTSHTVPNHFVNGDHVNQDRRFFHSTFPCQQVVAMSPNQHVNHDCGYYTKFSCTSHQMKKKLAQRCSWKLTSFILVIVCVALLACALVFAVLKFTHPFTVFHVGQVKQSRIPPKTIWQTKFIQNQNKFVKFNFSLSRSAIISVYGRRYFPPTIAQFDFSEVFNANHIASRQPANARVKRSYVQEKDTALIHYMEEGEWFLSVYNDRDTAEYMSFKTDLLDSLGTDCPNDCNGRGDCLHGKCSCFPGFKGWDCSEYECPELCSRHGKFENGVCQCHKGWKGRECEIPEHECAVTDCNGNGQCINGKCKCRAGFRGPHCGLVTCIDPNCSGHGVCHLGKCVCYKGYTGLNCNTIDKINVTQICARDCSGHGTFDLEKGECQCNYLFTGPDCEQDGCPNDCSGHGDCRGNGNEGWKCNCHTGWKGRACDQTVEQQCEDGKDDDRDGLTDCADPDCCLDGLTDCADPDCCLMASCRDHILCRESPDPDQILIRRQPPSSSASFYEKMKFLIQNNGVQKDTSMNAFNESQASVIRGRVVTKDKSLLVGVVVRVSSQPLYGYTLSRRDGMYDILVNGGGSVTLEFTRTPFQSTTISVLVPWNQIINIEDLVMLLDRDQLMEPDPSLCGVHHDHYLLRPVVLSTWQHTQLGACPDKSTIIPESQVLQESIKIPGTDVHLVYHSSETEGYKSVILIQLTPSIIPTNLALVYIKVSVQGVQFEKTFEADPGLKYTYAWDRKNAYKQKVYGIVPATVHVGYQYTGCDYIFWEVRTTTMTGFDLSSSEIGGWNLDIHHTYNFQRGILHKGDGSNIYMSERPKELITVLGTGDQRSLDCGTCNGLALNNRVHSPVALASGRDGSLYIWDLNFIRRLSPSREDIASILQISTSHKPYMTVSPVDGRLYLSDMINHRVIRVGTMGPVRNLSMNYEVVAGDGEECTPGSLDECGDGGLAINARLVHPKGIAISKEGIVYIADNLNIRRIDNKGKIMTLIGSQGQLRAWEPMSCEDSQPASKARLQWPTDLAVDPVDNTLHILDKNVILKLTKTTFW
ncbi:hypothetical protein FSP39_013415 [Pinctada imbricata]|uniref:EGF-like domain-containing protein n=1 Tax=Pinctada imbricata TaxID=66713 RepID=A0AA88YEI8_PINIB|nr:hypothetical protein FSP39_013415 [Pinctada imbricata]